MHLISTHRSFGAFLVLLVSAILLSTWSYGPITRLARRQDTTEDTLLKNSTAADPSQSLGVHDYQHNLSITHGSTVLSKRARTLTYDAAVCKGRELYNKVILRAFDGQGTGARDYGENDINNGWTKEPLTRLIPSGMDEAFKSIGKNVFPDIGERIPTFEETKLINLVQDKDFTNSAGKKQKVSLKPPNHNRNPPPSHPLNQLTSHTHRQSQCKTTSSPTTKPTTSPPTTPSSPPTPAPQNTNSATPASPPPPSTPASPRSTANQTSCGPSTNPSPPSPQTSAS